MPLHCGAILFRHHGGGILQMEEHVPRVGKGRRSDEAWTGSATPPAGTSGTMKSWVAADLLNRVRIAASDASLAGWSLWCTNARRQQSRAAADLCV